MYLTDTILRDDHESEIHLLAPPCNHMGARTDQRAKVACGQSPSYLPVYQCELHRLCSPFGACKDPELIRPCEKCRDYQRIVAREN